MIAAPIVPMLVGAGVILLICVVLFFRALEAIGNNAFEVMQAMGSFGALVATSYAILLTAQAARRYSIKIKITELYNEHLQTLRERRTHLIKRSPDGFLVKGCWLAELDSFLTSLLLPRLRWYEAGLYKRDSEVIALYLDRYIAENSPTMTFEKHDPSGGGETDEEREAIAALNDALLSTTSSITALADRIAEASESSR